MTLLVEKLVLSVCDGDFTLSLYTCRKGINTAEKYIQRLENQFQPKEKQFHFRENRNKCRNFFFATVKQG